MKKHLVLVAALAVVLAGWFLYQPDATGGGRSVPRNSSVVIDPAAIELPRSADADAQGAVGPATGTGSPAVSTGGTPDLEDPNRPAEECTGIGRVDLAEGRGSICGKVITKAGQGIPDVVVTLIGRGDRSIEEPIFSDSEGGFQFVRVPEGEFILLCEYAPDEGLYLSESESVTLAVDEKRTLNVTLEDVGTGALTGKVSSESGPLGGCRVELQADRTSFQAQKVTEADGTFILSSLPQGSARVRVIRQSEGSETVLHEASVEIGKLPHLNITVPMKARCFVDVTFVDAAGRPVPDTQVWAMRVEREGNTTRSKLASSAYTDGNGAAKLDALEPGSYTVQGEGAQDVARLTLTQSSKVTLTRRTTADEETSATGQTDEE